MTEEMNMNGKYTLNEYINEKIHDDLQIRRCFKYKLMYTF